MTNHRSVTGGASVFDPHFPIHHHHGLNQSFHLPYFSPPEISLHRLLQNIHGSSQGTPHSHRILPQIHQHSGQISFTADDLRQIQFSSRDSRITVPAIIMSARPEVSPSLPSWQPIHSARRSRFPLGVYREVPCLDQFFEYFPSPKYMAARLLPYHPPPPPRGSSHLPLPKISPQPRPEPPPACRCRTGSC